MTAETLDLGRKAFADQSWTEAFSCLRAADQEVQLDPEDLARLATAAYLIGKDAESEDFWTRAYHQFLSRGDAPRAARCAFWLSFELFQHGERARAGAWVARAQRLLDEGSHDCVEQGYVLLPIALQTFIEGDIDGAYEKFCQAAHIGHRFGDPDLTALARHSRGRVLIRKGEIDEGVRLLDEAMVAVDAREVSPLVAGDVYCSVIEGCIEILDLRRAQEWTAALTRWCESQRDLVPFRGECLTRRAELLQLHGAWPEAIEAARLACDRLLAGQPAAGAAFYRCGELHRLCGEFAEAEEAFREASRYGRTPQPGMALLRLVQGQTEAAETAIRLAVDQAQDRRVRLRLLPAFIEIMLAAPDVQAARSGAEELEAMADELDSPYVLAVATQARGAVLLVEGDCRAAIVALRKAWAAWQEIESPYEAARVRILIGLACRNCGDKDAANMELDAARRIFEQLGAHPDLARMESLTAPSSSKPAAGLSAREVEVLRLIAAGKTNRSIASELFISERTVERHVSNILSQT
jgi:DNA-binding CsgD family transcriptional regulator/tetratricopeptide (TPR) repeat protein